MGEKGAGKNQFGCKSLKRKYRCEKVCDELNELIKNATGHITENRTVNSLIYNEHRDLIISHLKEKTDINKKLSSIKSSDNLLHHNLLTILFNLKEVDENDLTDKLMELLDLKLSQVKKETPKDYKFIFLLNIEKIRDINTENNLKSPNKEFELYNHVLNLFKLKRTTYSTYFNDEDFLNEVSAKNIKSNESFFKEVLKGYHQSKREIVEFTVKARDIGFAIDKANKTIEAFLGFLSLYRHIFAHIYGIFDEDNLSIDNIKIQSYFILKNDKIIEHPYLTPQLKFMSIKTDLKSFEDVVNINIKEKSRSIQYLSNIIENIQKDKKNKLWEKLQEFLVLYYSACSEENLPYSFLQFWTLAENIIKYVTGPIRDKSLLRIMTKILNKRVQFSIGKDIGRRIEYLHSRRNRLVHEGKYDEISKEDKVIAKYIADSVLDFYISYLEMLRNRDEYNFVLQNMAQDDFKLERYLELLNDLLEKNKR